MIGRTQQCNHKHARDKDLKNAVGRLTTQI